MDERENELFQEISQKQTIRQRRATYEELLAHEEEKLEKQKQKVRARRKALNDKRRRTRTRLLVQMGAIVGKSLGFSISDLVCKDENERRDFLQKFSIFCERTRTSGFFRQSKESENDYIAYLVLNFSDYLKHLEKGEDLLDFSLGYKLRLEQEQIQKMKK